MPSQVWGRSPQEAYKNPYEYAVQDQFVREARAILKKLNEKLQKYSMKFHRDDCSEKKAIWMLQLDALDSLRDALEALTAKKHRITAKSFRDIIETLDLAAFFHSSTNGSKKELKKWYKDEVILHKVYRDFIKKTEGEKLAVRKKDLYKSLSRFTHRTYCALLDGYGLGKNDMLWHDGYDETGFLILPQTTSVYYAELANLISEFLHEVSTRNLLTKKEVQEIVNTSLESNTVVRRLS